MFTVLQASVEWQQHSTGIVTDGAIQPAMPHVTLTETVFCG